MNKIKKLLNVIDEKNIEGLLLIKNEKIINENTRYISGFTGSTAYLLITPDKRILITDDRYVDQAKEECSDFEIINYDNSYTKKLKEVVKKIGLNKIGIEVKGMTLKLYEKINKTLDEVELVETEGIIESLRTVKDKEEIQYMKQASQIAEAAFEYILDYFKPGVKEKELALEFEYYMKKNGAEGLAFDLILCSGNRTTHQHGVPSDKVIEKGDFVVMDFGAKYRGYCSDITRTFVMGKATQEQKKVYNTVKESQQLGLDLLKAGIKTKNVCQQARKIIEDAGYGDYTGYGLGHGLGLEVHEQPGLKAKEDIVLEKGNVVTVEPGIYISGWGGVRIEDTVVIEENGCRNLTNLPKDLIEI